MAKKKWGTSGWTRGPAKDRSEFSNLGARSSTFIERQNYIDRGSQEQRVNQVMEPVKRSSRIWGNRSNWERIFRIWPDFEVLKSSTESTKPRREK